MNPIDMIYIFLQSQDIVVYGFLENRWVSFHMFAGGLVALLLALIPRRGWDDGIYPRLRSKYLFSKPEIFMMVFILGWWYEIYQYANSDVIGIYGSKSRFFKDSFGDLFGEVFCATLVLIFRDGDVKKNGLKFDVKSFISSVRRKQ